MGERKLQASHCIWLLHQLHKRRRQQSNLHSFHSNFLHSTMYSLMCMRSQYTTFRAHCTKFGQSTSRHIIVDERFLQFSYIFCGKLSGDKLNHLHSNSNMASLRLAGVANDYPNGWQTTLVIIQSKRQQWTYPNGQGREKNIITSKLTASHDGSPDNELWCVWHTDVSKHGSIWWRAGEPLFQTSSWL